MSVALHGFSWDASSSYARGAAHGPAVILSALANEATSPFSLSGIDIREAIERYDFDPLPPSGEHAREAIHARVTASLANGMAPLSLGGDHSVSFPILMAMRDHYGPVNILHIDAHTDLYNEFEGDPFSHACPFTRAIENGCVGNLVQVGLRSITPDARAFGREYDVTMLHADQLGDIPFDRLVGPLYISIDLDGIDPAFAPGVSHPEPGGLSSREVISLVNKMGSIVGADVVELNPERDINMMTALLAARLAKELAAKLIAPQVAN